MAPIVGPAGPLAVAEPGEVAIVGRRLPPAYRAKAPWPAAGAGPKYNQAVRRSSDQPLSITTGRGPKLPVGPPTPAESQFGGLCRGKIGGMFHQRSTKPRLEAFRRCL